MKPTPLLDLWQKPDGAGEPLAVLATTFAFDPDFFERDCLARFVAVESVNEGTGSADDVVARLELEEGLRAPMVAVLADRSAQAERSSLRWDLLHCQVDGGLLHSKVAILIWENVTRVVVGSANVTPAGYRYNIELVMAADLGPTCMFPRTVLEALADELESYLDLVPGLDPSVPARQRVSRILELFRTRSAEQSPTRSRLIAAIAPTNGRVQPLDSFRAVWSGAQPLGATHVSPYWDANDGTVLKAVNGLLTGRPASKLWHDVAVTIGPGGETSFPPVHLKNGLVDEVVQLGPIDENIRPLHAKCLVLHSNQWVAALIGSSNHTRAGLGMGGSRRHRELNVWLGAPADSQEGMALWDLVPLGIVVDIEAPYEPADDEDEAEELAVLPAFFQLCRLSKSSVTWSLTLTFETAASPKAWRVTLPNHDLVIDHAEWRRQGSPASGTHKLGSDDLPMFVDVEWDGAKTSWVVIADDRHELPPGFGLKDLRSAHLLEALASGKTLAQAMREKLERDAHNRQGGSAGIVIDPLKRFDSRGTLLRRGRALAAALSALERRLARPVTTLDALEARLSGPLGPRFIARKVVDDHADGTIARSEAMFTVAEVALVVSRVAWGDVLQHVDREQGLTLVDDTLEEFVYLGSELGKEPAHLTGYLQRAIEEAKRCLVS
jgi:hypothetical protein